MTDDEKPGGGVPVAEAPTGRLGLTHPDTLPLAQVAVEPVEHVAGRDARLPSGMHETGMLGRFNILDTLGAGGMGVVLAAYDPQLDRKVAIKVLRTRGLAGRRKDKEAARLLREARAMAQLSHPHVVTVYEAGTIDERVYLAMEYVAGQTLRAWLADGPDGKREVAEIVDAYVKAGRGLAAGHAAGLVHRDFKPDNVLVGFDGRVRVIDFGLARPTRPTAIDVTDPTTDELETSSTSDIGLSGVPLTTVGTLFGTPMYMAPEQHDKQELDARADQFAFCVSLFEALYGRVPFPATSYLELAEAVTRGKLQPPEDNPAVPSRVTAAVLRGLSVDREARFVSMEALLDELSPPPRRRRGLVIASTALGAAAAVAITLGIVRMTASEAAATDPCAGGAQRFAGVWDDAIRARVRAAFAATRRSHADHSTELVVEELDHYKADWVMRQREVCQAAPADTLATDLREQCLRDHLEVARSLTQLFAAADGNTVDHSVVAVRSLEPARVCVELRAGAKPAPTALQATQLQTLQADVARVVALLQISDYKRAEALARSLLARAEPINYPFITAELRFWLGTAQMGMFRTEDAERTLRETLPIAARAKHDQLIARIWTYLVWVLGNRPNHLAAALAVQPVAEVAIVRADSPVLGADLDYNLGVAYYNNADYPHASARFEAALAEHIAALGENHPGSPKLYASLGGSYLRSGNLFGAKAAFDKALAITETVLGPSHPDLAIPLAALGSLAQAMNDFDKATKLHLRALEILEEIHGPYHEQVGQLVYSLAVSANGREDYEGAIPLYERALAIFERISPDHPSVGLSLVGLADCREEVGDYPRAADEAERGYQKMADTKDPAQLALARYVLAKALWAAKRDRGRARTLAIQARAGFASGGLAYLNAIAAVDKWFAKTGAKPPP